MIVIYDVEKGRHICRLALINTPPPSSLSIPLSLSLSLSLCCTQIFGWLASFIWFASIWFVYKDTYWHNDRTGPLAKLYQARNPEGQEGRQEGDSNPQRKST